MKMTLYLANRKINDFMKKCDLKPNYKWFVQPLNVEIDDEPNQEKINNLANAIITGTLEEGLDFSEIYVPAVLINNCIYKDPSVKELSDGQKVFFV